MNSRIIAYTFLFSVLGIFVLNPTENFTVACFSHYAMQFLILLAIFDSPSPESLVRIADKRYVFFGCAILIYLALVWESVYSFAILYFKSSSLLYVPSGKIVESMPDCLFYSISVFTTVGCSTMAPSGRIQLISATEPFFGYMLIGFVVSYIFILQSKRDKE